MEFANSQRMRWMVMLCSYFCWVGPALACPSCPVGRAARQQVCEDAFMLRLMAVILPFIVVGLVSFWVERTADRARGIV